MYAPHRMGPFEGGPLEGAGRATAVAVAMADGAIVGAGLAVAVSGAAGAGVAVAVRVAVGAGGAVTVCWIVGTVTSVGIPTVARGTADVLLGGSPTGLGAMLGPDGEPPPRRPHIATVGMSTIKPASSKGYPAQSDIALINL